MLLDLLAFPTLIVLGLLTASRLGVLGTMDAVYLRAINRIRSYYYQSTPQIDKFLVFPPFDDDYSNGVYGGWVTQSFYDKGQK